MPLRLTARVDLLEHAAHQPTIAIIGVGSDNLWSAKAKTNSLVLPRLRPEAGAGDHPVLPAPRILNDNKITRPHQGMPAAHQLAHQVPSMRIGRLVRVVTEHFAGEIHKLLSIVCLRPAQEKTITEVAFDT